MKRNAIFAVAIGFALLLTLASSAIAGEENETVNKYSLWIGGHYTDFSDYTKKVGEYDLGNSEGLPEFAGKLFSRSSNSIFKLYGHYYDDQNIYGVANATVSDKFKAAFMYRSLVHRSGQDMLVNLNAREFYPNAPPPGLGGKTLTHEILDPGADYDVHRQEILSKMEVLLSERNNVRMMAAHRSILKDGTTQKMSNDHCYGCHTTSRTGKVETRQHQLETGIDADVKDFNVGYRFGYRHFQSNGPDAYGYWSEAKHPGSNDPKWAPEFGSRVLFDDTTLAFGVLPETEKMSHKVRLKGDVGKGNLAGSFVYSRAENKSTTLTTDAYAGVARYAVPLSPKMRLLAKMSMRRVTADDPFIDLPTFRAGAADGNEKDFDYIRYSTLDRSEFKASAELITRVNPRWTLALLGGYEMTNRDDYVAYDDGTKTKKMIGQAKLRFRKGLRYSSYLKYRFESISDPFVSARGLFESSGYGVLVPAVTGSSWIFYWQREALRYQDITSMPTQVHNFEWRSTWQPSKTYSLNLGVKGKLDKNGDLDSLDVEHTSLVPHAYLNLMPNMKWTVTTGYTYNYDKSRIPIAIALFDG